jgi:hypothetical protein
MCGAFRLPEYEKTKTIWIVLNSNPKRFGCQEKGSMGVDFHV